LDIDAFNPCHLWTFFDEAHKLIQMLGRPFHDDCNRAIGTIAYIPRQSELDSQMLDKISKANSLNTAVNNNVKRLLDHTASMVDGGLDAML
jgi:hypothetical protein